MTHSVKHLDCQTTWVCGACGEKYGSYDGYAHTWHDGECDICGGVTGVTHVRHFGWLPRYECDCKPQAT